MRRDIDLATPLGHSIAGFAVAHPFLAGRRTGRLVAYGILVFAACAPDLDFVPGILVGEVNRFHQSATHSIAAALIFGGLVALTWRGTTGVSGRRFGAAAALAWGSHLLLDLVYEDTRPPIGIPLLWPFSSATWVSPVILNRGVRHGPTEADLTEFLGALFSRENLSVVARELTIVAPLVVASLWLAARLRHERSRPAPGGSP